LLKEIFNFYPPYLKNRIRPEESFSSKKEKRKRERRELNPLIDLETKPIQRKMTENYWVQQPSPVAQ
jgi:hypothetical protein